MNAAVQGQAEDRTCCELRTPQSLQKIASPLLSRPHASQVTSRRSAKMDGPRNLGTQVQSFWMWVKTEQDFFDSLELDQLNDLRSMARRIAPSNAVHDWISLDDTANRSASTNKQHRLRTIADEAFDSWTMHVYGSEC